MWKRSLAAAFLGLLAGCWSYGNGQNRKNQNHRSLYGGHKYPAVWASWSWWSSCSQTCNNGVTRRKRECLRWTGYEYNTTNLVDCTGTNIDYKVCQLTPCQPGTPDFRSYQCSLYNNQIILGIRNVTWTPKYQVDAPCELVCQVEIAGLRNSYRLGTVLDGTYCHRYGTDVCLYGKCYKVACNNHLGTGIKEDMCRVCGGTNDTCTLVKENYTVQLPSPNTVHKGYNEITVLLPGSTHFTFRENSRNYLALMDSSGSFVLNGYYQVEFSKHLRVAGTTVFYERRGENEVLYAKGPTSEKLHVSLLYRERNKGVTYEYWKANNFTVYKNHTNQLPIDMPRKFRHIIGSDRQTRRHMPKIVNKAELRRPLPLKSNFSRSRSRKKRRRSKSAIKKATEKEKKARKNIKDATNKDGCKSCVKATDRNKQYCASAFVSRVKVLDAKIIKKDVRYVVSVMHSYRKKSPLMKREFIWLPNGCRCPRLRAGKEYVVFGEFNFHLKKELRLVLLPNSYVRRYSERVGNHLSRLEKKFTCVQKT